MIRRVDDPSLGCGGLSVVDALGDVRDLPQDRVERMLQCAVERIALGGAEFFDVGVNPFACFQVVLAVAAPQISGDFVMRQNGLGDVIEHDVATIPCVFKQMP